MFESLLTARLERHPWWTDRAVALASALHLALIATLASISSLLSEEVRLPELPIPRHEFVSGLQLVLPGPPPPAPALKLQQKILPPAPDQLVQPVSVPDAAEVVESPAVPEVSGEGPADPDAMGSADGTRGLGVDGGMGEGSDGGPGANGSPDGNSDSSLPADAERDSSIVRPESIVRPDPVYPRVAQLARVEGIVMLKAVVGLDGSVESVTVESGNPMLVEAARSAVLRWRYTPALRDGQPIRVFISVRVSFALR